MNNLILIEDIKVVNSAESYFGDIVIRNKRAIVPFFNLSINNGHSHELLATNSSKYLNFAYLIFENLTELSFEWKSTFNAENNLTTECYGGISIYDNEHYEFWVTYLGGKLLLNKENLSFSKSPFDFNIDDFSSYNIIQINDVDNIK